jgi:hypothetical protein
MQMTEQQATEWVYDQDDTSDQIDEEQLEAAFEALYGRPADDEDRQNGLWSLCCNATPNCGTRPEAIKEDHSLDALCKIIRARVAEHAGNPSTEEALHMSVSLESSVQEFIDNWGGEHMTNNEWADEYLAANAEYQQDLLEETSEYSYLANLTKGEFKAVTQILKKYGVKGLLGTVLELAQFNLNRENIPAADKARAERVTKELAALIERLQEAE